MKKTASKSVSRLRLAVKILASFVIAFLFAEVLLRIFPIQYTNHLSEFSFLPDSDLGYLPTPEQNAQYNLGCLKNPHVQTNQHGFRGKDWENAGKVKIALLGDSYLLALTISERMHLASRLREISGAEVWNAGVSGFGTYQEYLVWRKYLMSRKPDITVLYFYSENDVRDNHCALCKAEGQVFSPCLNVEKGEVVQNHEFEKRPAKPKGLLNWISDHCYSCRLIKNLFRKDHYKPEHGTFFGKESFAYNVYRPNRSPKWEEGWIATRWAMNKVKQACDSVGSRLLVVNIPGPLRLSSDWRAELEAQIGEEQPPADLDFDLPLRRLDTMVRSEGISMLDLTQGMIDYREMHHLPAPGFGWCCDGHWNPIGHRIVADLVYSHLREKGWLNGPTLSPTPSPKDLLGQELFDDIFNCRTVHLE